MKLKFLLWAAMSLTFTGVFMSCGDEGVTEEMMEEMIDQKLKEKLEEEKEGKEDEEGKEENDEKGEDEKNEEISDEILDILEFVPTSDSTVKVNDIKDRFRTEITIPSTIQVYGKEYKVTSLNRDAFRESNVKRVKLTEGFTEIPDSAFYYCSGLTSIEIPSSVTSIGYEAFAGCYGLTSIEIPSSVTSIGESAFSGCRGLTSIEIPSSVTSIGNFAFSGSGLTSIEIPSIVTSIGERAFGGCSSLTSIEVSTDNPNYTSINGVLFDKDIKTLILCPGGFSGKFSIIPSSVTSIGDRAFHECRGLTSIEIPSSVTSIGEYAFYNCKNADIVIDNSEENVDFHSFLFTFYYCKSVTWKK